MLREVLHVASIACLLLQLSEALYNCPIVRVCDCAEKPNGVYELQCPTSKLRTNNTIHIMITRDGFSLNCRSTPNFIDYIPELEPMESTYFFKVEQCSIPDTGTISDIMIRLGAKNPEIFQMESSDITNITRDNFKQLVLVKKLYLKANQISVLPADLLYDMKDLVYIEVTGHEELEIPEELFKHSRKLVNINFGQNNLRYLPPKLFANLSELTTLNLWSNKLTQIEPGMFEGLSKLRVLELFVNQIRTLPDDILAHVPELRELSIRKNALETLPEGLLQNNSNLQIVKLDDNPNLSTLPDGFLSNLPNLTKVCLSGCNLQLLPESIFWGSTNLQTLDLSRNKLKVLPRAIFNDTEKLEDLNLQSNGLEIVEFAFAKLKNLKSLRLGSNNLRITHNTFERLQNLEELYMPYNNLELLSYDSFKHLQKLKIIDVSYNQLSLVDVRFPDHDKRSIFSGLRRLEKLFLEHNNITDFFRDWTINLTNLTEINLSNNLIKYLEFSDFNFLSSRDVLLYLDHNEIETIDLAKAEALSINNHRENRKTEKRVTTVFLNDNPLNCDCRVYDLVRYFRQMLNPAVYTSLELFSDGLTCATPEPYEGKDPTTLAPQVLTCVITDGPKMPEECSTEPLKYRTADDRLIVNCSNNQLTAAPNLTEIGFFKNIELHLNHNNLTRAPGPRMGYDKVVRLDLSDNHLSSIDWLPPYISELYLHNNNFTNLRAPELRLMNKTSLRNMTFHNNPWVCDCDIFNFMKYLQENFKKVLYLSNITCNENGKQLTDLVVSDLCPLPRELIILFSVFLGVLGLVIGVALALYFRYQQEIKVWLYAHNMCMYFLLEEELDKDKLFDAFISYSHKDEEFVVNELVPRLEAEPAPFTLCLHYRNWQPGELITKNIAKSVEDSRRTLVVLSPNFLQSEWGKMEFRTAHVQALSEGRARVIVVIYGDVGPVEGLDPELKAYLTTNTYVKWGDPWFWDKLRYALPHRTSKYAQAPVVTQPPPHKIKILDDKLDLIHEPVTPPAGTTPPADAVHLDPLLKSEKTLPTALNVALINGTLVNNVRDNRFNNNVYNSDIRSIV